MQLIETLNLNSVMLVGHSTGGDEIARYIGCHSSKRVSKTMLVGSVTPFILKTDSNPNGLSMELFDAMWLGVTSDRSQFFKDFTMQFFGSNRTGAKISKGVRDLFWAQGMMGGLKNNCGFIRKRRNSDRTFERGNSL